jgi:hypothetical protein
MLSEEKLGAHCRILINTGLQPGGIAGFEAKAVLTASRAVENPLKRIWIRRT